MAAEADMEFCLLGPLLVRRGGSAVVIAPGMQRSLLAALALAGNKVVPVDELVEVLWGAGPPLSARASLQNAVMRLRRSIADDHQSRTVGQSRIIAQPNGYRLRVEPGELDVDRFEDSLAAARKAHHAGSPADAAALLGAALSLWRGPPLAGIPSQLLAMREVPRLEEMRLQAIEARIDADLLLGRHADVILELRQLVNANPLRERLHALLMLALYRDGQQAGALEAYRSARGVLAGELGVEPGQELRQLHEQILAGEAAVAAPGGVAFAGAGVAGGGTVIERPSQSVPHQLPAAVMAFAGRIAELSALASLVDQPARSPGSATISAICGTAGIGKTALAVHWAHQVARRFPDGQLYVNLQGFGPSGPAMTPDAALRLFLDGLGVPGAQIPPSLEARAALYRSLLSGKRMLIVLDNARDLAQVEPLLPASTGCLVLITSRNELVGLLAAHGAHLLTLGLPSEREAHDIVARRLGRVRVDAEPVAVTELAEACARLPIALSIAAARAASRPDLPLATLAAELRDAGNRLDGLRVGDAADVRAIFSWSYEQLSEQAARMLRMLGLHPGPDITAAAAASLAGVPLRQARRALRELAAGHLITEDVGGRHGCHDLLRAYASEQAHTRDGEAERRGALHRVLDHYLHTACAASRLLEPDQPEITPSPLSPLVEPERFDDREQAVRWFRSEREVLLAATRRAGEADFTAHAWQLPWVLATFLTWYAYWHELAATERIALTALRRVGDRAAEVQTMRVLGLASLRLGACDEASDFFNEALGLAGQLGDKVTMAHVHADLAVYGQDDGDGSDQPWAGHAEQSLLLFRAAGDRFGEARVLNNLGWLHIQQGSPARAIDPCTQALAIFRELGDSRCEIAVLDSLGYAYQRLGLLDEAIEYFQQAISADGQGVGQGPDGGQAFDPHVRAEILTHLGDAHDAAGHPGEAEHAWGQALRILDELHDPAADDLRRRVADRPPVASPVAAAPDM